jgi:hypothetical protein
LSHPGLAEAGRESGEILREMKELSASARAANHIRKVRYCFPSLKYWLVLPLTCCIIALFKLGKINTLRVLSKIIRKILATQWGSEYQTCPVFEWSKWLTDHSTIGWTRMVQIPD